MVKDLEKAENELLEIKHNYENMLLAIREIEDFEEKAREKENTTETVKEVTKVTTTGKKKFTTSENNFSATART